MARLHRSTLVPLAVTVLLAVPAAWTARAVLHEMGAGQPFDVEIVPRGEALRFASAPIRLSFGNLYWLATVQYIGDADARARGYEKLAPLVDLVTELDPQHGYAYQTAGIVLSGAERLEESDAILQKGMTRGPNWWSYPYYIAFNNFFYRGDYAEAARWAEIAAKTKGASPNISHLAMALRVKSGAPDQAIEFLSELRGIAKDDVTAKALEEQYQLALLQRDFQTLDAAVDRYRALHGRAPERVRDLVTAGIVPSVPAADPFGGTYVIRDGKVHATGRDHRFAPAEAPRRLDEQRGWTPVIVE